MAHRLSIVTNMYFRTDVHLRYALKYFHHLPPNPQDSAVFRVSTLQLLSSLIECFTATRAITQMSSTFPPW